MGNWAKNLKSDKSFFGRGSRRLPYPKPTSNETLIFNFLQITSCLDLWFSSGKCFIAVEHLLYWRKVAAINWTKWPHDRRMGENLKFSLLPILVWEFIWFSSFVQLGLKPQYNGGKLDKFGFSLWTLRNFNFLAGLMLIWRIMKNGDTFKPQAAIFHCLALRKHHQCKMKKENKNS